MIPEGEMRIDRRLCTGCGACADACPAAALTTCGREMTVAEVIAEVEKDRPFYETSEGGMTVSGGEPLMQPEFTVALLEAARDAGLHTALDTSGYGERDALAAHPLRKCRRAGRPKLLIDSSAYEDRGFRQQTAFGHRLQ